MPEDVDHEQRVGREGRGRAAARGSRGTAARVAGVSEGEGELLQGAFAIDIETVADLPRVRGHCPPAPVAFRSAAAVLIALLLAVSLAGVGCGGSSSSSSSPGASSSAGTARAGNGRFANTKFVLHAGLAFGVFHRYIYQPFKAGSFKDPAHHKLELVKAGAAGLIAYHEVTQAKQAAQGSAALRELFAPLAALGATLSGLGDKLNRGRLNPAQIESANSAIAGIKQDGSSSGLDITERAPASLR